MQLNLKNKKVLITGSSKGIGMHIAKSFSELGNDVFINSRSKKNLTSAKNILKSPNIITCSADLSKDLGVKKLYNFIKSRTKNLDILVCNIGSSSPQNSIGDENINNWLNSLNVNLLTAVNTIYYFKKLLKNSKSPSVICISSICGVSALGAPIDYSVSKAALISFVKNQSRILSKDRIRINVISPGNILFEGSTWDKKNKINKVKVKKYIKNNVPLNMFGSPKHISDSVLFLASDVSSFTTGSNIVIDGGQTA
jgi:3-oxoacyl-[acyl-carrier protein] reductase